MDQHVKDYIRFSSPSISTNSDVFEPTSSNNAKQRATLVEWLNGILPDLSLPINASDEELRAFLVDGSVLCRLLNKLKPGSVTECVGSIRSSQTRLENVHRFLSAMDEMGLPRFQAADLEKGSMKIVLDCLLTLQTHFTLNADRHNGTDVSSRRLLSSPPFGEDRRKSAPESKFQRALRSPIKTEPSAALINHVGHKFHEVFQLKQVSYTDLPAARISEMMKSNSLDNAPTQSLLSVINGILDESIEQKNGEIPHRVACLLRKVVQEIERRICTQAEHLRTQNNLFKAREEKYQSRIRVLEALATGTSDETQIVMNQLQQIKSEKNKIEEKKKVEEQDMARLMKEKDNLNQEISNLRQQLEIAKRSSDEHQSKQVKARPGGGAQQELNNTSKEAESLLAESRNRVKELEERLKVAVSLQTELANKVKELEDRLKHDVSSQNESTDKVRELEDRLKETTNLLTESRNRVKELEDRLKVAVSLQTESINKVKELEDRLNVDVSSQSESTNKLRELEHRLKETTNLLTESTNKLTESTNKVKELEDRLKENVSSQAELTNKLKELEDRLKETTNLLTQSRNKVKELEASLESKSEWWKKKEQIYHIFTEFQLGALRELKFASQSIHQEIVKTKKNYSDEFVILGSKFKALDDAAKNYYSVLAENRKLHNELQELKGNIRVYCRIRPFLPGQKGKSSIIEYIGDNGELIVSNPSKQGKEGRRSFKFDKVYSPTSTQAEVFTDTQPLVQSVLDGYNVCIFAYGQTGSGKTYTMTGPDGATEDEWGVNYRALNNLFRISQSRESSFTYEVSVQMVEIYNEQVRDLLSNGGSAKRLGILSTSQPNGLAVPDASIHVVKTTSGVLELMDIGLKNRAKSSTALNERSSRSHSVVSIHARGLDLKSGSSLRGSLHLVDLAGSERVDRSEVTGDRLKEAQHINKSLSALGDVIFALAQKNSHVPYRNSKLTQVLQSSLGGQAKTLMFVQLNPDATSYSETLSTLKFAERVSGVELGAAKSSKDGRDVRELMEQVASLKDTIAKKDEEIETLQLLKDPKNGSNGEKRTTNSLRYGSSSSSSSSKYSMGGTTVTASSDQPAYDHHDYYSDEADGSSESISLHDEERQTRDVDKRKSRSAVPRASTKSASLRKSVSGTNLSTKSSRRWQ